MAMIDEKDSIQYTSESEIETRDNLYCVRTIKYTLLAVGVVIIMFLTYFFLDKLVKDLEFRNNIIERLVNYISGGAIGSALTYIGLKSKN